MKNFIDICRLIEPAKRAGYYLTVSKNDYGTSVQLYPMNEKQGGMVYYLPTGTENDLAEALVIVREIIACPTPIFPNGEHLELEKVDIVVSGDWQNGNMVVTSEGDIFNLLSNEQLNRIMEQLGGYES